VNNLAFRKGFSLVELLFIILIICVLSSLAVTGITDWIHKVRVRNFAEEMLSDLEWARALAFKKGSSKVEFQGNKYLIYVPKNSSSPIKEKVAPETVNIETNLSFDKTEIKFKRNKLPDIGGNIEIKDSATNVIYYRIVIKEISGRIYLEKLQ